MVYRWDHLAKRPLRSINEKQSFSLPFHSLPEHLVRSKLFKALCNLMVHESSSTSHGPLKMFIEHCSTWTRLLKFKSFENDNLTEHLMLSDCRGNQERQRLLTTTFETRATSKAWRERASNLKSKRGRERESSKQYATNRMSQVSKLYNVQHLQCKVRCKHTLTCSGSDGARVPPF